jgi:hypothetical protein
MPKKDTTIVTCKRCQNKAYAKDFVLDPYYGLIVCPHCVKERRQRHDIRKELAERRSKQQPPAEKKQMSAPKSSLNSTPEKTKIIIKCHKCRYEFPYDEEDKIPNLCPFCGAEVLNY